MFTYGVVLAAGRGIRMDTDFPKPALVVNGKPMIERIVESLEEAPVDKTIVVVGYKKEVIIDILKERVTYVVQKELTGTASAVKEVLPLLKDDSQVIILPGDIAFLDVITVKEILTSHTQSQNDLTVVSMKVPNPTGFGRIIRKPYLRIVEEKETSEVEKKIQEVNTGIMVVRSDILIKDLDLITNHNHSGEYYLTDLVEIVSPKAQVGVHLMDSFIPVMGVNDRDTLDKLQKKVKNHWQNPHNVVK